jgi:hypothetical protein
VRFRVGRQLVVEKDLDLAQKVLAPVLFSAHGTRNEALSKVAELFGAKASSQEILEAIDAAARNPDAE